MFKQMTLRVNNLLSGNKKKPVEILKGLFNGFSFNYLPIGTLFKSSLVISIVLILSASAS